MLLVRIGEQFGLSDGLAALLAPVMQLAGLPAETGIVWAVTILTGIYGGAGVYLSLLPALDLTVAQHSICLLYTSPSPRDATLSRMPSSA